MPRALMRWPPSGTRPNGHLVDVVETFIRHGDAEHWMEEVRGDDPRLPES